jgi:DNA repair protein RadC
MEFKNKHEKSGAKAVFHAGHRSRVRKIVETNEYLLHCCITRKDTKQIAHSLIDNFGNLANVLDASKEDLKKIEGIGDISAVFLHTLPFVFERYLQSKREAKPILTCPHDIYEYLGKSISHLPREEFYVIGLDNSNNVINKKLLATGGIDSVSIKLQDAVKFALNTNASKIILLHNHPTSDENPSVEDIEITRRLHAGLSINGIELSDHLIVNYEGKSFSFAHNGLIKSFDDNCKRMF